MSDQIDIAVDLGVVPPPLPEIEFPREFAASVPQLPSQVVEGILPGAARRTSAAPARAASYP